MSIFSNSGFLMTKLKYRQGSEIVLNKSVHFPYQVLIMHLLYLYIICLEETRSNSFNSLSTFVSC